MRRFPTRLMAGLFAGVAALALLAPAAAELADVYLTSGVRLRGDVTRAGDEVILRNAAGETRLPASEVARIVPVGPPESPASQAASAPATQPVSATQPASAPADGELSAAPWVSEADVRRLRLRELTLEGVAERVRVRFTRRPGQSDLALDVLAELRTQPGFRSEWADVLTRGRPEEKLQLIVRLTGLKYADRIEIDSDPQAFTLFRRDVLPLLDRGCGRAGCHGGTGARAFRFPIGSPSSERYAYTCFVLLDQMQTQHGPLLDRTDPTQSVLLGYLLPRDGSPLRHPPVGRGPRFKPVLRDKRDPKYQAVLDWIDYLIAPRPDYGLEYKNVYVGPFELHVEETPDEQAESTQEPAE